MNAGTDHKKALKQAQANADYTGQPRWLFACNAVWWISPTEVQDSIKVEPKDRTLKISAALANAVKEIAPSSLLDWEGIAISFISGSVVEFWQNAAEGSGLTMEAFRERTRAFVREGDTLVAAIRKAQAKS